jgi:hypothetical protein
VTGVVRVAFLAVSLVACAEDAYEPDVLGGEQARAEWLVAEDGTRHLHRWIHADSGESCQWTDAGDGVLRCLPGSRAQREYIDPGCEQVAYWSSRMAWEVVDGQFEAFVLGDPFTVTRTYTWYGDACWENQLPQPIPVRPRVLLLPAESFATAADVVAEGRGQLRAIIQVGADGSRLRRLDAVHVGTGAVCSVTDDSLGGWECKGGPFQSQHVPVEVRTVGTSRLRWKVFADPAGDWVSAPYSIHDSELGLDCEFELRGDRWVCAPRGVTPAPDTLVSAVLTLDP